MRVDKFGIRGLRCTTINGPYWLSGKNPAYEKLLDAQENLVRPNPKKLVWYMKMEAFQSILELEDFEKGKTAYIIGKGPSLDDLESRHFEAGLPIFCCNDSVIKIESMDLDNPIYSCQCDPDVKDRSKNKKGKILVTVSNLPWYADCENMFYVTADEIEVPEVAPVSVMAIDCARFLGCTDVIFYAFDGAFGDDCNYAKCIGYASDSQRYSKPERFKSHGGRMIRALDDMPYKVVTRKTIQSQPDDDTPSQSPDNPQQPCEEQDALSSIENINNED